MSMSEPSHNKGKWVHEFRPGDILVIGDSEVRFEEVASGKTAVTVAVYADRRIPLQALENAPAPV